MYGVIFDFLREYVTERHGGDTTWKALLAATGNPYRVYFPVKEYPDEEMVDLANGAAEMLSLPLNDVLEDFGSYVGPRLISFYKVFFTGDQWNTFDVIEIAGSRIHDTIHRHNPTRKPPDLSAQRESDDLLVVHYHSQRRLCPVVRGIIRGLGEKYGERFDIDETQCMHHGADECVMRVTRLH